MGWGVSYGQPAEPKHTHCGRCGDPVPDHEASNCPDCWRGDLCDGCVYECSRCKGLRCKTHIVATSVGGRMAVYLCHECAAKQEGKAA